MIGQQPQCPVCRVTMVHDYGGMFRCPTCDRSQHWLDTEGKQGHRSKTRTKSPTVRDDPWRRR